MSYIVRIPKPCHEDWNKMTANEKGRFCSVCSKTVRDFTQYSDNELYSFLEETKETNVCGRFKNTQINRPINITISLDKIPENLSITRAFALAILLVFGSFLISCTDMQDKKIENFDSYYTTGVMIEPLYEADSIVNVDSSEIIPYIGYSEPNIMGDIAPDYFAEEVFDSIIDLPEIDVIPDIQRDEYIEQAARKIITVGGISLQSIQADYMDMTETSDSLAHEDKTEGQFLNSLSVFPNPSNGEFQIAYELTKTSAVELGIYSMDGVLMKEIIAPIQQYSGKYQMAVNLTGLSSGIYFCRLLKDEKEEHQQIVITK